MKGIMKKSLLVGLTALMVGAAALPAQARWYRPYYGGYYGYGYGHHNHFGRALGWGLGLGGLALGVGLGSALASPYYGGYYNSYVVPPAINTYQYVYPDYYGYG